MGIEFNRCKFLGALGKGDRCGRSPLPIRLPLGELKISLEYLMAAVSDGFDPR
ncbi:MAG: hypothetical protein KME06_03585 [Kastovskya adunca ATA6-11-RM4]|nr:hypothetical protein [Kastovskya adunca ATA6-11-RM4]